jgi:iron complex transport system substrate-binding protein
MRGGWLLSLAVVMALTAPPACGTEVRDMLGRSVRVPDRVARVVSLAPSLTETVYAVSGEAELVGVTEYCDFPPAALKKAKVGGISTPNFEAILSLKPDLVLATTEGNRAEDVRRLADLGIAVYVVRPTGFLTVLESIERVGRLLNRMAEAHGLMSAMQAQAGAIAQAVDGAPRPRVLYVLWGNPLIVPGRDTVMTDLIRRAGGNSVTEQEPIPYPRFSTEEALVRQPDWVVLAHHGRTSVDDLLRDWPHLSLLPAVRRGHVALIEADLVHKPGPRIIDGLRALARLLHPERVK